MDYTAFTDLELLEAQDELQENLAAGLKAVEIGISTYEQSRDMLFDILNDLLAVRAELTVRHV